MSVNITIDGVAYPFPSNGEVDTAAIQLAFARALATAVNRGRGGIVAFGALDTPADTATNFLKPFASAESANTDEIAFRVPFACTIDKLYVRAPVGPSGAAQTFTVRKNGVATTLACALSVAGSAAQDTSNSVTFAAGDRLSVSVVGGVGISLGAAWAYATMRVTET